MSARRLVVLVGSHELGEDPRAFAWADRTLQTLMLRLAREGTQLVTGGEPGPEIWAESLAFTFDVPCTALLRDGSRRQRMQDAGRWAETTLGVNAAVARRDHALIERAVKARAAGTVVSVLALLAPGASERSSSQVRAKLADEAGLPVQRSVWGKRSAAPQLAGWSDPEPPGQARVLHLVPRKEARG